MLDEIEIDKQHIVVDLSTGMEIVGAVAIDPFTNHVLVRYSTYVGEEEKDVFYPSGVKIVRRR